MIVGRPAEEVGVVPVYEVRGGVVVGLGPRAGDKSPGTAVVLVRSRLQNGEFLIENILEIFKTSTSWMIN